MVNWDATIFGGMEMQDNFYNKGIYINKGKDFYKGIGKGVHLNEFGEIVLDHDKLEGIYESPVINTENFKDLIGSWNAEAEEKSNIELNFQIRQGEKWSKWFTYGKWWSSGNKGSVKGQFDSVASMEIDTIKLLNDKRGNGFRYRVILRRANINISSPIVRLIAVALNLDSTKEQTFKIDKEWEMELDLPKRSQMIVPKIGNVICSPTSLAMVLEYYGHFEETEKVAKGVFDTGAEIYGNWVYNVAYAGTKGFQAYVARFTNLDQIKAFIGQGRPVVVSIRTKSEEELLGAPQTYPSGHLIAVRGFKIRDGIEYIIVNDPAALDIESVRREYLSSQFTKVWNGITYCIVPR